MRKEHSSASMLKMNAGFVNYNQGKDCRQQRYTLMFEDEDSLAIDIFQILL